MKINQDNLFNSILNTVFKIEHELNDLKPSFGIFLAPELYLAFEVGKEIYKNRNSIFGKEEIKWVREKNLGNGGPSDLIFESKNDSFVFEFKIADTWNSYERDIDKLMSLKDTPSLTYHRFFIVLIDKFRGKEDGRINNLESTKIICLGKKSFPTQFSSYKNDIDCLISMFKV